MKTVTTLTLLLLVTGCFTQAQDVTIYAKKISPTETPQEIKEALKKDFPENAEAVKYYMFPENMVDSEWSVALDEHLKAGENDHYAVKLKGKKGGYVYGLYNKDGELEVLKMEAVDFVMPPAITTAATTGEYEGYKIKSNKYKCYKVLNKKTNKEYIQVEVAKGKDIKTLYFTPAGEFIREKQKLL